MKNLFTVALVATDIQKIELIRYVFLDTNQMWRFTKHLLAADVFALPLSFCFLIL